MKRITIILLILCLPIISLSQENDKNKIQIKFSGFVKNDFFWDTRQTISAREGSLLLWGKEVIEDADGNDINAKPNFNFLSIQSKLSLAISGTEALGAKVSGKLEVDFFGQANDNINLLRLRHAFVKLNWTNTELLLGQYWNPLFVTASAPGCSNAGSPIQAFGRNPQIRLTQKSGKFKFIAIASSQRDYATWGANGPTSKYLRNSAIPELNAQIHFENNPNFITGLGTGYKQIVPEIQTPQGYSTNQKVTSYNGIVFMKIKTKPFNFKAVTIYGQNISDVLSIGGFAVTKIKDPIKGFVEYSPLSTISAWTDIQTNGEKIQFGIFAGYSQNLGSSKKIVGEIYGLGTNIESLYRIAPRIIFNTNKIRFTVESGYTVANFGKTKNIKGIPTELTSAKNTRLLVSVYYSF